MDFQHLIPKVVDLAIEFQQIPAPTFAENQRAEHVRQRFQREGLLDISMDEIGNVYARLPGIHKKPPLVISAHSDTVFPPSTPLDIRREGDRVYGPGIGDNSLGMAGLFGLLWALRMKHPSNEHTQATDFSQNPALPGDIWFVINVCEEGLGDLIGMRAVVARFGDQPLAYIVLEGMALGQVYHRALGVQRYKISVHTPGGHSWVNYGRPSAVHELAAIINHLAKIPLPEDPRTTLNVGVIEGGTSVNTIAAEAHLELDLRSESAAALENLAKQVEDLVADANRPPVKVDAQIIGERPAGDISPEHPLVQLAMHTLFSLGMQPVLTIGSTDANIPLSRGLPAICIGLSTGNGAHTMDEYIDIQPLEKGLEQLVAVVEMVFSLSAGIETK